MRKITFLNTEWLGSSSLSIIIYTCPVPENTFYNIMKEQVTTKVQSLPLIVPRRLDGGRVQSWFSQPNAYSTLPTTSAFPILHGNLLPPPQTAPKPMMRMMPKINTLQKIAVNAINVTRTWYRSYGYILS